MMTEPSDWDDLALASSPPAVPDRVEALLADNARLRDAGAALIRELDRHCKETDRYPNALFKKRQALGAALRDRPDELVARGL